jgi:hypothetical protein
MSWTVVTPKKWNKKVEKLPRKIQELYWLLIEDMGALGPARGNWSNFGRIVKGDLYHCHLDYNHVVVWSAQKGILQQIEVTYVGTREGAPY